MFKLFVTQVVEPAPSTSGRAALVLCTLSWFTKVEPVRVNCSEPAICSSMPPPRMVPPKLEGTVRWNCTTPLFVSVPVPGEPAVPARRSVALGLIVQLPL